jgi:ribosomal protein S18 acetylase RimI-like enzyme
MTATEPEIHIRPAVESDLDALLELLGVMDREDGRNRVETDSRQAVQQQLSEARGRSGAFVARHGTELVGLATWQRVYFSFGTWPGLQMDDLYVKPEYRRLGLARKLVQATCALARAEGLERVDWTVDSRETRAVAFYRNLGGALYEGWLIGRLSGDALRDLAGPDIPHG